jgi:hypothetical protein
VTPGPARSTSATASASRTGRASDAATLSAGRTTRPTRPRNSGARRRGAPRAFPRSNPGPRGSGPRRGSVAEGPVGCSWSSTAPVPGWDASTWPGSFGWSWGRTRAARRATRLRPSKAAWWQATASRVPRDPATTRRGGWVARSKRATRSGAASGSSSTISGSGGGPGCQVSPRRRAPVIGTARCRAASRSWSRSTGAARVAAATTAQAVRRSGKRSRASALAEAGAGSPSRPPLTRSPGQPTHPPGRAGGPGTGRLVSRSRPAGRARPAGGTTVADSRSWRTRGGGGCRRSGGCG